jgi:uncharacterized Zn finger protein
MEQAKERREIPVATIRASCPTCGDVELTSRQVTVRVCAGNNQGSYVFRCPDCTMAVSKLADPKIVDLLVSSGVRLTVWHLPAELAEAHEGAPITYDDLLEFHYAIQQDGWFERLTSAGDLN